MYTKIKDIIFFNYAWNKNLGVNFLPDLDFGIHINLVRR